MKMILANMKRTDPVMQQIGEMETEAAVFRIMVSKESPDGEPWQMWSGRTRKERVAKGNEDIGILWDTGRLMSSIHAVTGAGFVEVGTEVPYASDLQTGTDHMAARPFLGWDPHKFPEYEQIMATFIEVGK
jgi:phage gpG-like protein